MAHSLPERLLEAEHDIEAALNNGQVERFSRLLKKRGVMMRDFANATRGAGLSSEVISRLIAQNARWIERGRDCLSAISADLAELKSRKVATSTIAGAYRVPPNRGRCIQRTG